MEESTSTYREQPYEGTTGYSVIDNNKVVAWCNWFPTIRGGGWWGIEEPFHVTRADGQDAEVRVRYSVER